VIGETRAMKRRRVGMSCWAITVTLTRPQPDTTVCTIIGKIDMDTTPVLRDAVAEARGDDNAHLVIESSAVSSMDSTGLYVLFDLHKQNIGGGGHLSAVIDANFVESF
jgi:anti-anti-sigma factor